MSMRAQTYLDCTNKKWATKAVASFSEPDFSGETVLTFENSIPQTLGRLTPVLEGSLQARESAAACPPPMKYAPPQD
jgi:hypothetical protein